MKCHAAELANEDKRYKTDAFCCCYVNDLHAFQCKMKPEVNQKPKCCMFINLNVLDDNQNAR